MGWPHLGLLFAEALGAHRVVAFSRHADKREHALADKYIVTAEDQNWEIENASSLDLILCTISSLTCLEWIISSCPSVMAAASLAYQMMVHSRLMLGHSFAASKPYWEFYGLAK